MPDSPRPPRQWPGLPARDVLPHEPPLAAEPDDEAAPEGAEAAGDTAGDTAGEEPADIAAPGRALTGDEALEEAEDLVQADLGEMAGVAAERDEYLDRLRRLQADFENYKKRVTKQQVEHRERAAEELITKLLPVLDHFDLALAHGSDGVEPVYRSLNEVLGTSGLERIDPMGQPFDPNEHDAVLHEAGDGEPEVIDVLRAGYRWRGRVLRAAMVKVKG